MTAFCVSIHFIACPVTAGPAEEKEFAISQFTCRCVPRHLPVLAEFQGRHTELQIVRDRQVLRRGISESFSLPAGAPRLFLLSRWESKKFLKRAPK